MALYLTEMVPFKNDCRRCLTRAGILFSSRNNKEIDDFVEALQIPKVFNDRSGGISIWFVNERWHAILSRDPRINSLALAEIEKLSELILGTITRSENAED